MAGRDAGGVDVVSDLGRDDDVVAPPEQLGEDRLTEATVAVDRRRVEEVDARVQRGAHEAGLVVDPAPPVGRDRPRAEADLGDDEIARAEPSVFHDPEVMTGREERANSVWRAADLPDLVENYHRAGYLSRAHLVLPLSNSP